MPTPSSGTISMDNMRDEITRSTGSVSMSEIRTRYGGSGAISFSDLYDCEGFVVTCGTYTDKFFSADGFYRLFSTGSVAPNESNGHLQFASQSFLDGAYSSPAGSGTSAVFSFSNSSSTIGRSGITVGYRGTDVTRCVTANTNRTKTADSEFTASFSYDFPASGTIHCLVQF